MYVGDAGNICVGYQTDSIGGVNDRLHATSQSEIWEGGLHCTSSLQQRRRRKLSKKSVGPESYLENIGQSAASRKSERGVVDLFM